MAVSEEKSVKNYAGMQNVVRSAAEHASTERRKAFVSHLLIIDCETQRFTIEGPLTTDGLNIWYREADHALMAGRILFCVPITDMDTQEIAVLGTELGYELWPPNTLIAPPNRRSGLLGANSESRGRAEFDSRVQLLNQKRSAWLQGLCKPARREAKTY